MGIAGVEPRQSVFSRESDKREFASRASTVQQIALYAFNYAYTEEMSRVGANLK
jgi:hypothetical protein